jgi:hypothetical protein
MGGFVFQQQNVMVGLDPTIHVLERAHAKTWMVGSSPTMTMPCHFQTCCALFSMA